MQDPRKSHLSWLNKDLQTVSSTWMTLHLRRKWRIWLHLRRKSGIWLKESMVFFSFFLSFIWHKAISFLRPWDTKESSTGERNQAHCTCWNYSPFEERTWQHSLSFFWSWRKGWGVRLRLPLLFPISSLSRNKQSVSMGNHFSFLFFFCHLQSLL